MENINDIDEEEWKDREKNAVAAFLLQETVADLKYIEICLEDNRPLEAVKAVKDTIDKKEDSLKHFEEALEHE